MLSLTFLGHQGWLVSTPGTNLLIDPLLGAGFGHGGLLGQVYPPRVFDFEAFPPIDALVLTHEHDDHFDIPSLARIDRRVPIYLAGRSSIAAQELLEHMDFALTALEPERAFDVGGLHVHPMTSDHRDGRQADEWDATPLFIHARDDRAGFLTSVDVRFRERELAQLAKLGLAPGLWAHANNCSHAGFQTLHTSPPASASVTLGDDSNAVAKQILARHDALTKAWSAPELSLISGAGWTLHAERSRLNHHLFPADHPAVVAALGVLRPQLRVTTPRPGQTPSLDDAGRLASTLPAQPFLSTAPVELWPGRDYRGPGQTLRDYGPACGATRLAPVERETLLEELVDFARYLYGGPVFAAIHSLPPRLHSGHVSSFCLLLRDEEVTFALAYDPSRCAFVPSPELDPIARFASGIECWSTDLHALLTGALAPSALCYAGRMRVWNHAPSALRVSPALLWHFCNPLRRPRQARRLYQRLLERERETPVLVRAS